MSWGVQATGTKKGVRKRLRDAVVPPEHEEERQFALQQLEQISDKAIVEINCNGYVSGPNKSVSIVVKSLPYFEKDPE